MKASEEKKEHTTREKRHEARLQSRREEVGREKPTPPARDDRAEVKPWRPGLRK